MTEEQLKRLNDGMANEKWIPWKGSPIQQGIEQEEIEQEKRRRRLPRTGEFLYRLAIIGMVSQASLAAVKDSTFWMICVMALSLVGGFGLLMSGAEEQ